MLTRRRRQAVSTGDSYHPVLARHQSRIDERRSAAIATQDEEFAPLEAA
jgi:hypothetical protein